MVGETVLVLAGEFPARVVVERLCGPVGREGYCYLKDSDGTPGWGLEQERGWYFPGARLWNSAR